VCAETWTTPAGTEAPAADRESSSYLRYRHSTIPMGFLTAVADRTGCAFLCDVNNIYVSASNPAVRLGLPAALPAHLIGEIHLAGHSCASGGGRTIRVDDHGSRVSPARVVAVRRSGRPLRRVPTLIEWDTDIPALHELLAQARSATRSWTADPIPPPRHRC